ncbi:hypothetical protein LVD15_16865 [Fulvivirga maritima]|uniref:hypothetical protein n=1 Tax=Fulvivirga maritima TaxID=2904247 RepID=UPI001F420204|nr:hypothetical protein [Fulvivirga maritima]UII24973.1 hypothetical protein LVD15_16865 [Fulvivirga maritima]
MFSDKEFNYISDQDFLLTKRQITEKIIQYLSNLESELKKEIHSSDFDFPDNAFLKAGKISKGENFKGLPYLILDYPRMFSSTSIFAYRTMFWWGNFFSNTLHVKGSALKSLPDTTIQSAYPLFIQTLGDEWDHSLESANAVEQVNLQEILSTEVEFLKISQKIPLSDYGNLPDATIHFLRQILDQ